MRSVPYKTVERWPASDGNPHRNVVVRYRRKRFELECGAGSQDSVTVFREGARVYVLSVNRGMPYAGLAEYDLPQEATAKDSSLEPSADVFLQLDYEQDEILGRNWTDLRESTIARRLSEYLPYE